MEERMETESVWEQLCRVCLQSGPDLVSLFDCDENNELLRDKYHSCSAIEVSENEQLPTNICLTCVDKLLSAYQFKQQCISSFDTLKKCLDEYQKSEKDVASSKGTEVITIKQEDGVYVRYELPVDYEIEPSFTISSSAADKSSKKNRGRPRKYPDPNGVIELSPYRKKEIEVPVKEDYVTIDNDTEHTITYTLDDQTGENMCEKDDKQTEEITNEADEIEAALENEKQSEQGQESDEVLHITLHPDDGSLLHILKKASEENKRKGKGKRIVQLKSIKVKKENEEDDMLLKESIMENIESSLPDSILNPQSKEKKKYNKRIYKYDKVHTCEQCGSSFRSNASLQAHIRRHLGIKPYTCTICGYSCVLNMELRRHMMRHTGIKPYKCRICERHFGDFGSRQKHERLHLGQRPYRCEICGKSFTYSYVLSNHMLTHTGEKKYSCAPCNKRFTKAHHLKYHNRIHHKEVFLQQQLVQEAKKMHQINMSDLTSVCTEQLLGLQGTEIRQIEDGEELTVCTTGQGRNLNFIESQETSEESRLMKENIQIIQQYNNEGETEIREVKVETDLL